MQLTPIQILQKIVDNNGSCDWVIDLGIHEVCSFCPLGNKIVEGRRLSCIDYLERELASLEGGGDDAEAALYKRVAEEELVTLAFNDMLKEG